jgi:hypothetical protein
MAKRKSNGTGWLAGLLALWGGGAQAADAIPFLTKDETAIVVPVTIAGLGTLPFLLDTGTGLTWVDAGIADALALPADGAVEVSTIAGGGRLVRSRLPRLVFGSHVLDAVEVMAGPLPPLPGVGANVRGILGQSVLSRVSHGIDYRRRRIVFEPIAGRRVSRVSLEWRLGRPAAVARDADSRSLALVLDAGLDAPVLFEKSVPVPYAAVPGLTYDATTSAGTSRLRAVEIPGLRAGSVPLGRVQAAVVPDGAAGGREEDGLLPTRMFASVYFDLVAREIALEAR